MQKVLMVAFHFPPGAGAGVQRTMKFARYLPENGWLPVILTVINDEIRQQDASLLNEIPAQTLVERTPSFHLPDWLPWRVRNWIARWILTVDGQVGWIPIAVKAGRRLIRENTPLAIYTTSAPYSSHLIGLSLKQKSNLPWVADFRDPWVGNFSSTFPTPLHEWIVKRLERRVVLTADAVMVVSEPMKQGLCKRILGLPAEKVHVIPNGFDPADFAGLGEAGRPEDKMLIVYNGSFYGKRQTARYFLQGVRQALDSGLIPPDRLLLRFIGNTGKDIPSLVRELNLEDVVEICGYLPHKESLTHLLAADILLLVIGSGQGSEAVYTGKVFEYLAANKTIFCLADEGAAASLVREAQAGVVVPPGDTRAIGQTISQMFQDWSNSKLLVAPVPAVVSRFNRQLQAQHLAEILDGVSRDFNT